MATISVVIRYYGEVDKTLGNSVTRPRIPAILKHRILVEQGGLCLYCLSPFGSYYRNAKTNEVQILKLTWDHMVPYEYTRTHKETNLAAACHICNTLKGSMMFNTVEKAREYLNDAWDKKHLAVVTFGEIVGANYRNSCAFCGNPLLKVRPTQKFCCNNCRIYAWNRAHPRVALKTTQTSSIGFSATQNTAIG